MKSSTILSTATIVLSSLSVSSAAPTPNTATDIIQQREIQTEKREASEAASSASQAEKNGDSRVVVRTEIDEMFVERAEESEKTTDAVCCVM